MVSSSKILTVSYGTFSCTAEGFEDPLAVVKDTTHFFRGVISEDRFFGAEPPQFDPELASEMMRDRIAADHGAGRLSLGSAMPSNGAASSGALAAALAAGPARPARPAEVEQPGEDTLPDDDTIEATAVLTEAPSAEDATGTADDADAAAVATSDRDVLQTEAEVSTAKADASPAEDEDISTAPDEDTSVEDHAIDLTDAAASAELLPVEPVAAVDDNSGAMPVAEEAQDLLAPAEAPEAALTEETAETSEADPMPAADVAATFAATAETAEAETTPVEEEIATADPVPAAEDAEIQAPAEDAPAPRLSDPLGVAAKLERIRAVVAGRFASTPKVQEDATAEPAPALAAPEEPVADAVAEVEETAEETVGPVEDTAEVTAAEPVDDVDDDALASLIGELESDLAEDDEDSLAAALDDMSGAEADAAGSDHGDNLFSGSIAELMAQESGPFAPAGTGIEDDVSLDDDMEDEMLEDEDEAAASVLSDWDLDAEEDVPPSDSLEDAEPAVAAATAETDASWEGWADDDRSAPSGPAEAAAPAPIRARVVKVKRAEFDLAVASGALEEITEEDSLAPQDSYGLSREEEDELARELAAVKAELAGDLDDWDDEYEVETGTPDAAIGDSPELDERPLETAAMHDEDADEESAPFRLDNPLPAADRDWSTDIDALDARASAALGREDDAEDGDPAIDEGVRDSARKAVKMASPARALLTEREVEDDDTSRLLDQTNSEMDEPEGNRRRSAIAHLRAAVAATKADRLLGRKTDAREEQEPYREDLASVVRPRRPQSGPARTERPAEPAPAPLKLVAEQRVGSDTAEEEAPVADAVAPTPRVTPVRPRRVRRASDAVTSRDIPAPQPYGAPGDAEGFASYATSVGAVELPDLLEAAAAYMSYVEGRDQFSRPQLMTTVRQAELSESSREDRLRSFGQLLREGKIQKTAGGRFTASDRISFKPERAAG